MLFLTVCFFVQGNVINKATSGFFVFSHSDFPQVFYFIRLFRGQSPLEVILAMNFHFLIF